MNNASINADLSIDAQRVQQFEGINNFRDLGGYVTADGRRVRWGRVFRSAKLSKAAPRGLDAVQALSIASVFDFRTAEERGAEPSLWLQRPGHFYESPKTSIRAVMDEVIEAANDEASATEMMKLLYTRIPVLYREEFSQLFRQLANGGLPLLLHCTAGKDRTGIASALLLTTLGVPREQVIADYILTEQLVDPSRQAAQHQAIAGGASISHHLGAKPIEVQITLWRARREFIESAFAFIESEYGSIEAYLALEAAELDALRQHLLE